MEKYIVLCEKEGVSLIRDEYQEYTVVCGLAIESERKYQGNDWKYTIEYFGAGIDELRKAIDCFDAQMEDKTKTVKIIFRDINGNKYTVEIPEDEMDMIEEHITENDEILFVYYDAQMLWCGLGCNHWLTTDELIGFFA